jgi:putative alpha-1,2-mannosidase
MHTATNQVITWHICIIILDKPEKTTEKVHYILDNFYKNAPDGLIGNEDCGQMSAWYVLSSMGIYDVTPGKPEWIETEPLFKNVRVKIGDNVEII